MFHAVLFNVHSLGFRRPPGPYRIATILRDNGWDVEVVDFVNHWELDKLKEFAKSRINSNTKFIGFGVMFDMWNKESSMEKFSQWLKEQYPDVKQILGGQWPPIHSANNIDYFITGYAENAIISLVKVLVGSEPLSSIAFDPKYLSNNKKVISANTFLPSFPMKSLLIDYEDRDFIKPTEWLTIEFGRGCKFKCPYCTYPILGVKGDYTRDSDDAFKQLQTTYDKYGVTNYFVADETFNDSTDRIVKFADVVDKLNFDPWFSGFIRADLLVARQNDWEHLSRMGFLGQFYGIETMNHETAKAIKKGMDPERLKAGLLEARQYFLSNGRKQYRGTIAQVFGLPHETKDSIKNSLQWLEDNWQGEAVMVSPLEIPTDPTVDVLSELSINWKEYGYSEYKPETITKAEHYAISQGHMNSKMIWQNEHLNYNEAVEIADTWKLRTENERLFGAPGFGLDYPMSFGMSLDQALALRPPSLTQASFNDYVTRIQFNIDEYINNKLSI